MGYCAPRTLGTERGPRQIRVVGIAPGFVATEGNAESAKGMTDYLVGKTPLGRMGQPSDIADTMLALLASRAPSASICPSDVARALSSDERIWRAKMPAIRRVAGQLAVEGRAKVTRGAMEVDALSKGGSIRIRRP